MNKLLIKIIFAFILALLMLLAINLFSGGTHCIPHTNLCITSE